MRQEGDYGYDNYGSQRAGGGGRGRDRYAKQQDQFRGKKASFQWINSQIIAASENGGIPQLMSAVVAHLPRMNLVNLSTAVHRIAKLTSTDLKAQEDIRHNPVLDELLKTIASVLGMIDASDAQPQSLSNVAWSLATMRLMNRPLVQIVVSLAVTNIARFKPFELSTMLWAFAKLTTLDQSSWFMKPIFQASASLIIDEVHEFSFRCLATTAWAFATAKQRHARLFRSIAAQMLTMVRVANCQEMANAAWAFATADFHDEQLFTKLAEAAIPRLEEFKPQELSNMLWGFATNGFFHEDFFTRSSLVVQRMPLQSQHLANILWAFVRARPHHPVTTTTILMLLPSCTRQLETFKPQEVSSTALAVAKAFGNGEDLDSGQARIPTQNLAFPSQVQDFFKYAMPWAMPRLREFSPQSLANTITAFAMVRTPGDVSLFIAVGKEVHERYHSLEPTALLHLLKGFSSAPQDLCGGVVKILAKGVSCHIDNFRPQEIQTLSRICVNLLNLNRSGDLSSDELRRCCASIATNTTSELQQSLLLPDEPSELFDCMDDSFSHSQHGRSHQSTTRGDRGMGSSLGKLALESVLYNSSFEGDLPSMPPNALYESDFHFTGRPSPPRAVTFDHGIRLPIDNFDEVTEWSTLSGVNDLSPRDRQIGVRPEIYPSANPNQRNLKARNQGRYSQKALKNQRVPANFVAGLNSISEGAHNQSNYELHQIPTPSFPLPVGIQAASQLSVPIPEPGDVPWVEYDSAREFNWKFTIKNSFFHVGGRDGVEVPQNDNESVDDGASQRSSSLPNRVWHEDDRSGRRFQAN